jgi:phosphomannomutase
MENFDAIFKSYDIRGIVPDQIYPEICNRLGGAFAALMSSEDPNLNRILVAHDMRPSADVLVPAFIEGILSRGIDVISLGLCSTDMLYYASGALDAPGAIFTASHNPAEYNGIKLCRSKAGPIGEGSGLNEIREHAIRDRSDIIQQKGKVVESNVLDDFVNHVLTFIDRESLSPLKVVVDTANGMGGLVVPPVFEHLPFQLDLMFGDLDGTFPNHPADPLNPQNLVDLQKRVKSTGADIGLAFDGDADRVFLVDEQGERLSGSTTTSIVAKNILEREPGASIIHNLICSRSVKDVIEAHGGTAIRSRVGHSFIKHLMAETDAAFGGEHSGHYYFRDNYRADSGLIAALIVLEEISSKQVPLSVIRTLYEKYASTGEVNFQVSDSRQVLDRIIHAYSEFDQDFLDGLTIKAQEWWFNLRPSNTEPLLRLNFEADDEAILNEQLATLYGHLEDFLGVEGERN